MSPKRAGQSVGLRGSCLGASHAFKPPSCDARATLIQLLLPAPVTAVQLHLASFWRVALPGN